MATKGVPVTQDDERVAVVFPGQGSQRPGMGRAWVDQPSFARWAEAGELLGRDVTHLALDADEDELRVPVNAQIALFVHFMVQHEAWRATGARATVTAGHSLGEYAALVAAGVLGFADGLRLVDARARATQQAADERPGTMVACLGFAVGTVEKACAAAGTHVANDNAPGQLVVAGAVDDLDRLRVELEAGDERGRIVPLQVGAAYHSLHMQPALAPFGAALDAATFADAAMPVVANVDARPHDAAGDWPVVLRDQLVSPVRWRETVGTFAELGVTTVTELGPSAVLTGLVKRTDRSMGRRTIVTPDDLGDDR